MGQCTACSTKKVRPLGVKTELTEKKDQCRASLVNTIHSLHKLTLSCNDAVQTCISRNNKPLALLFRCKYTYIKLKMKDIQEMIKHLDEACDTERVIRVKEILEEFVLLDCQLQNILLRDDVSVLLENDESYIAGVKEEISKHKINMKDIEGQVESAFQVRLSSPERVNRKRYSKQKTS
jgi:hypothetical protein